MHKKIWLYYCSVINLFNIFISKKKGKSVAKEVYILYSVQISMLLCSCKAQWHNRTVALWCYDRKRSVNIKAKALVFSRKFLTYILNGYIYI